MDGAGIEFRVTGPGGSTARDRFVGEELLLGSSPPGGLALSDPALAPVHLRLLRTDGGWLAQDFGGGARLEGGGDLAGRPLREGDILLLGDTRVELLRVEAPQSRPLEEGEFSRREKEAVEATLRWYEERLRLLNDVQRELSGPVDLLEVLDIVLEMVFKHLGPAQASVALFDADGRGRLLAWRQLRSESEALSLPAGLLGELRSCGPSAQVFDARGPVPAFDTTCRLDDGVRSVVAAPMMGPKGTMGVLALSSSLEPQRFSVQDLDLLTSLATAGALRLHSLFLAEEAAERRRLDREVALARRIQLALIPDALPEIVGYDLYGANLPSEGVSGDYFTAVPRRGRDELALWVADVCGKGMAASLLTASLEALAAGPTEEGFEPDEILGKVSRRLFARTPAEKYATAFLAILELGTGVVRYASAGHNPALVVRAGGEVEWLDSTGVPLGLFEDRTFGKARVYLGTGDLLALYTDGITEARNPEEEEFGADRFAEACRAGRAAPLADLAASLARKLDGFAGGRPFDDDRTLLLLRRSP